MSDSGYARYSTIIPGSTGAESKKWKDETGRKRPDMMEHPYSAAVGGALQPQPVAVEFGQAKVAWIRLPGRGA
jgi:hypothetical protein